MKMMAAVLILASVPAALAGNNTAYPNGKIAEFVVAKLDVTSFPSAIRPKVTKGKKTLGDYGYSTVQIDEREAVVKAPQGSGEIALNVLEENASGLYVCVSGKAQDRSGERIQRVYLLKANGADGLLKGREASKEFDACPVIGGQDEASGG
ncbi:MAG TPA: hypothetical protein VGD60_06660 [Candidatus Acidoferrales bacterium]